MGRENKFNFYSWAAHYRRTAAFLFHNNCCCAKLIHVVPATTKTSFDRLSLFNSYVVKAAEAAARGKSAHSYNNQIYPDSP